MVVPTAPTGVDGLEVENSNKAIFEFAETRPGTQVPEWFGLTELHPDLMRRDELLPTRSGAESRARLLAGQIKRCPAIGGAGEPRLQRKPAEQTALAQVGPEIVSTYRHLGDELIERAAIVLLAQMLWPSVA